MQGQETDFDWLTKRIHRSEARRQIWLPFFLMILVMLIIGTVVLLLTPDTRVSLVADFMLTIMVLCPLWLFCLFPLYLILIVSIYGMNKLHTGSESPLQRLEQLSGVLSTKVSDFGEDVNRRTTTTSEKIAPMKKVTQMFEDIPSEIDGEQEDEDGTTTRTDETG